MKKLNNNQLRIYIDMDHTFCDFDSSLPYWQERAMNHTERMWPWSIPGFFRSLLPMPGALEFWEKWKNEVDLWFLTRPSVPNRHCYTEKADWVHRYLGEEGVKKLILSPQKDLLIGDILIDDHHSAGQSEFIGEWWKFGNGTYVIPKVSEQTILCIARDWKHADEMLRKKEVRSIS